MIQLQSLYDSYKRHKGDIADVEGGTFIEWCDFILKFLYNKLKGEDPERVVQETAYVGIIDLQKNTLPSNFLDLKQTSCGLFVISKGVLFYTTLTAPFVEGDSVIGDTSGATATVSKLGTGYLELNDITGNFIDGELVQEISLTAGSATTVGQVNFEVANKNDLDEVSFGSTSPGFYLTGNNIALVQQSGTNLLMRYIPQAPNFTSLTDYFTLDKTATGQPIVEDGHKELLLKAIDLYYAQWDEDMSMEGVADARFTRVLYDVLDSYKRTAKVFSFENTNNSFNV
jgi:hypothetical protein